MPRMQTTPPGAYSFGPFVLDTGSYRLMRGNTVVQVSPKIIDLLLYLVVRPSVLVTKDELFKALWPDVAVTDNALTQAVSELRQALGDDPSKPKYVQTVARRGYRFVATVVSGASPTASRVEAPAETIARAPAVGGAGFRQREQRSVAGVAVIRHCRDTDQRSPLGASVAHHRPDAGCRSRPPCRHRSGRAQTRTAHRPRHRRQLSAGRRSVEDHRSRGRCCER